MVMAFLILISSTALYFFYCQVTLQKILRRTFIRQYSQALVTANRLEFGSLCKTFKDPDATVDYSRRRVSLKCDFSALTYMLKNAANLNQRYSHQDRLLMFYFRLVLVSLSARHWLRASEKPAFFEMATILQYFANLVSERMSSVRFGNLSASEYFMSL